MLLLIHLFASVIAGQGGVKENNYISSGAVLSQSVAYHRQAESGMYYYCARTLFLHGNDMLSHNI